MLDGLILARAEALQSSSTPVSVPGLLHFESARSLVRYRTYFRTETAPSKVLLKTALSLRYQVYCLERNFEKPERFPDKLETDKYDGRSIHGVLFYRPCNRPIGTARLILPDDNPTGLPVQSLLVRSKIVPTSHFPKAQTAEISRFAISRSFRPDRRERSKLPCLGLVQVLLQLSLLHDITHWAAVMQPALLRMLAKMGIDFTPIGPLVSYHGLRQPSVCNIEQMLQTLLHKNPAHWQIATDGGRLADQFNRDRFR
jgi:N-acyl-L-homoserine lactone synthetase